MDKVYLILLTVFLVLINGFFVAAEFALVTARRGRLKRMAEDGVLFAKQALWLHTRMDNALSVCQIGITMASLALGWVGEPAIARLLEPAFAAVGITSEAAIHTISFIVAFSIITAAHLVIGEQVPKILAIRRSEILARWCAVPLQFFYVLLYPLMVALSASTAVLLKLFGVEGGGGHERVHSNEELRSLVSDAQVHGRLSRAKHRLIDAAFEFDEAITREIMLPRVDVAYFDIKKPLADAFAIARATLHTRYPVCEGSMDRVIGVVHIKDLVGVGPNDDVDLRTIMRPPLFVPETMRVNKLLAHFQATRQHVAIVVDEYGTVAGLVTMENVLERIVGEVEDEFDLETPDIVPDGAGRYLIAGGLTLDVLQRRLGIEWTSRDVTTVSGFITQQLGRVPVEGDKLEIEGIAAEVVAVDNSRATGVRLILPIADPADEVKSAESTGT